MEDRNIDFAIMTSTSTTVGNLHLTFSFLSAYSPVSVSHSLVLPVPVKENGEKKTETGTHIHCLVLCLSKISFGLQ